MKWRGAKPARLAGRDCAEGWPTGRELKQLLEGVDVGIQDGKPSHRWH